MSRPEMTCQIAVTTKPTEAPVWEDVTQYLESVSLRRGRHSPLEPASAGTATARFNNLGRVFDPTYTGGPYYGNLKSTRRIRFRPTRDGGTYDLYYGYVDDWTLRRQNYGNQYAELSCADGLQVFSLADLSASYPQQRTDERIAAILTDLNWTTGQAWVLGDATFGLLGTTTYLAPVGDRQLDQGATNVQASTLDEAQALGHMQAAERTEFGFLFVGKNGAVVFQNRNRRLLAGSTGSLATFGDAGVGAGELPYVEAQLAFDDKEIWNRVAVTREGGTKQVDSDAASIANHFQRTLAYDTIGTSDSESATLAGYLKNRYATQRLRVVSMTLDPETGDEVLWPHLLSRELGDVVTVRNTPLGGGNRIEQVSFIEGMDLDWIAEGNDWGRPVWYLSPADTTTYWVLGQSLLETNTYLAL